MPRRRPWFMRLWERIELFGALLLGVAIVVYAEWKNRDPRAASEFAHTLGNYWTGSTDWLIRLVEQNEQLVGYLILGISLFVMAAGALFIYTQTKYLLIGWYDKWKSDVR